MIEYKVNVYPDDSEYWWVGNHRHRENGPAITRADGYEGWFLNGVQMSKRQHKEAMNPVKEMTMEEICEALGKNVKVIK